jgi:hypothetical protein
MLTDQHTITMKYDRAYHCLVRQAVMVRTNKDCKHHQECINFWLSRVYAREMKWQLRVDTSTG